MLSQKLLSSHPGNPGKAQFKTPLSERIEWEPRLLVEVEKLGYDAPRQLHGVIRTRAISPKHPSRIPPERFSSDALVDEAVPVPNSRYVAGLAVVYGTEAEIKCVYRIVKDMINFDEYRGAKLYGVERIIESIHSHRPPTNAVCLFKNSDIGNEVFFCKLLKIVCGGGSSRPSTYQSVSSRSFIIYSSSYFPRPGVSQSVSW